VRFREQSVVAETPVDHTSMKDASEQEMVLYAVIVIGLADASQTLMVPSFVEVGGTMVTSCLGTLTWCSPVLEE